MVKLLQQQESNKMRSVDGIRATTSDRGVVIKLPEFYRDHDGVLRQLDEKEFEIKISYVGDGNVGKAIILDHLIIPRIVALLNLQDYLPTVVDLATQNIINKDDMEDQYELQSEACDFVQKYVDDFIS